jgi:peptidoglycan/xylan/chitin deacetylase (PgdA/CDA1 family)
VRGGAADGPGFGAFVVSLDFELHWGVRDRKPAGGPYRRNLLGVRQAVPGMLGLFAEFGVAATWATVGLLFAESRGEKERFSPAVRPAYDNPRLDAYAEPVGEGEADDLLHYAPSLIRAIGATPRQEVATHTFSHYYCREPGQDEAAFRADLHAAVAIAAHHGFATRSLVFPRNQRNPAYDGALKDAGILCYRGNPPSHIYRAMPRAQESRATRAARLLDAYAGVTGPQAVAWSAVPQPTGLCDVPASLLLRPATPRAPWLYALHLARIRRALRSAARTRRIFHLWWHPHNFGAAPEANLAGLRRVLEEFDRCRAAYGMRSLTMAETALAAREVG